MVFVTKLLYIIFCSAFSTVNVESLRRNKKATIHSGILCAFFYYKRRTDEVSNFICCSSDLPSSR